MENKLCIIQKGGVARIFLNNIELSRVVGYKLEKYDYGQPPQPTHFTVTLEIYNAQINPGEPCCG
jgi:hypothetical protein